MSIDNYADIIDSRDIIARIEDLTELLDVANGDDAMTDEEREELATLDALAAEASDYSEDWTHGATLIRDSYFVEYAQELAEDIGAIDSDARWPCYCIDWERAASDLQQDYTSVDFDGVTYWVR